MNWPALMIVVLLSGASAFASDALHTVAWDDNSMNHPLPGQVLPSDNKSFAKMVKVANLKDEAAEIELFTLTSPGVRKATYSVSGMMRCEEVQGEGFVTMWSFFPDGGYCFSRTSATRGPMKSLMGTQGWRPFVVPFYLEASPQRPDKIKVTVNFSGRGTVYLGPITLTQYDANENPLALSVPGAWWSERTGGWIGGITGGIAGLLGGLIGLLVTLGKGRRFVFALMWFCIVAGVALAVFGLAALCMRQPFAVWYGPLLAGVIMTAVVSSNIRTVRKRYEAIELRRMTALDAQ